MDLSFLDPRRLIGLPKAILDLPEDVMQALIVSTIKKFLESSLKGLAATVLTALGAVAMVHPQGGDQVTIYLWSLIANLVHAAVSALSHAIGVPSVAPVPPVAIPAQPPVK